MVRQTRKPEFFIEDDELVKSGRVEAGIMKKGVIVRHLILPGTTKDSKAVIKYLIDTYGDDIYISIMSQYTPFDRLKKHQNKKLNLLPFVDTSGSTSPILSTCVLRNCR